MHELYHNLTVAASLKAAAITAAGNGVGVDLAGYEAASVVIDAGTLGGSATPLVTLKIQDSDDNAAWGDVAVAGLLGGTGTLAIGATEDETVYQRGYVGGKRYIRVICSAVSGTAPSLPTSATVVRGRKRHVGTTV